MTLRSGGSRGYCINTMSKKLSIISPVYNATEYIVRFLDSIISQVTDDMQGDIELILTDDGSVDDSAGIIKDYADRYPYIRYIYQENAGPAAARNRGLKAASGEWIYFADPDDFIEQGALLKMYELAVGGHRVPDIYIFDAYEHRGDKVSNWEHFTREHVFADSKSIGMLQRQVLYPYVSATVRKEYVECGIEAYSTPLAAPWDKLYNREILEKHGLRFDEGLRVLDDMVFNLHAFGAADRICYVKLPVYHYIHNVGTVTSGYDPARLTKDRAVWAHVRGYIETPYDSDREDTAITKNDGSTESVALDCRHEAHTTEDIEDIIRAFYKRIVKSYAIALKLSVFNPMNRAGLLEKIGLSKEILDLPEYREAFGKVKLRELEWRLWPVVIFGRMRFGMGLYVLYMLSRFAA